MLRFLLLLLLIPNLLACPLRCATHAVAAVGDVAQPQVACGCCRKKQPVPAPETPEQKSQDDCQCPNCLCDGATFTSPKEFEQQFHSCPAADCQWRAASSPAVEWSAQSASRRGRQQASPPSARAALIERRTLLI
jgi:hypothetical protein